MNEVKLSTGKLCPQCGCESLEEAYHVENAMFDVSFTCVALCGMEFSLNKLKNGKFRIYYNGENEKYLAKRFKFKP